MRFLADMPISPRTISFLRRQGHDVADPRDEGLQRMSDSGIIAKALAEKRTVLTMDMDFGQLMAVSGGQLPSILLFRQENKTAEHINHLLGKHLKELLGLLDQGIIAVFEESRIRIRQLPIK